MRVRVRGVKLGRRRFSTQECLAAREYFCRWYEFAGCAKRCARSARPLGLGDRGSPLRLPSDLNGPVRPPTGPWPALHRVTAHGVLVWAKGHGSQTHRSGSQLARIPRAQVQPTTTHGPSYGTTNPTHLVSCQSGTSSTFDLERNCLLIGD